MQKMSSHRHVPCVVAGCDKKFVRSSKPLKKIAILEHQKTTQLSRSSSQHTFYSRKHKQAAIVPTDSMKDKKPEEQLLLLKKMVQVRDVALDTKLEAMKLKFWLGDILSRQSMKRMWMEIRIMSERVSIDDRLSPSAPYFNGCPPFLRSKTRMDDVTMIQTFDRVMAVKPVNKYLLAVLCETGPDAFRSKRLKGKWALQEAELSSKAAKTFPMIAALSKKYSLKVEHLPLQEENPELLGEEENDDGKLSDVKRLDKEIMSITSTKVEWRRSYQESHKWYYPFAELSSREKHLTRLAGRLAKRAEARGMDLPTESEVIGCMLLKLLTTSAMSPSVTAGFFSAP